MAAVAADSSAQRAGFLSEFPSALFWFATTWGSFDCVASSLREEATALKMTVAWWTVVVEFLAPTSRKARDVGHPLFVRPREMRNSSFRCACALRGLNRNGVVLAWLKPCPSQFADE